MRWGTTEHTTQGTLRRTLREVLVSYQDYDALLDRKNNYFIGQYKTTASWMRDYIRNHPEYRQDSNVSEKIMYDLSVQCDGISRGTVKCPELFGSPKTKSVNITLPKCAQVGKEVEELTEKILRIENSLKKTNADVNDDFENKLGKSLGIINKNEPVQM